MAKEEKKDAKAAPQAHPFESGGGGMNTGAAIIGFILCFMAGAGVMWGYDNYRLKQGGAITADNAQGGATWSDEESPVPVSSRSSPSWCTVMALIGSIGFIRLTSGAPRAQSRRAFA